MDASVSLPAAPIAGSMEAAALAHDHDSASTVSSGSNIETELAGSANAREKGYVAGDMFCTSRGVTRDLKALVEAEALNRMFEFRTAAPSQQQYLASDVFRRYCSLGSPYFLLVPIDVSTEIERHIKLNEFPTTLFDPLYDLIQKRWQQASFWQFFKSAFSCVQNIYLTEISTPRGSSLSSSAGSSVSSSGIPRRDSSVATASSVLPLLAEKLFARCQDEFDSDSGWELAHEPRKNTKVSFKVCEHRRSIHVRSVSVVPLPASKVLEGALSLEKNVRRKLECLLEDVSLLSSLHHSTAQRLRYTSGALLEQPARPPCFRYFTTLRLKSDVGFLERSMDDSDLSPPLPPADDNVDPQNIVRGKIHLSCVLVLPGDTDASCRVITGLRMQPCGSYDRDQLHELILSSVPFWHRLSDGTSKPARLVRTDAASLPVDKPVKSTERVRHASTPSNGDITSQSLSSSVEKEKIGSSSAIGTKSSQSNNVGTNASGNSSQSSSPLRSGKSRPSAPLPPAPSKPQPTPMPSVSSSSTDVSLGNSTSVVAPLQSPSVPNEERHSAMTESNKESPGRRKGFSKMLTGWLKHGSSVVAGVVPGHGTSASGRDLKIGGPKGFLHRTHVSTDLIWSSHDEANIFDLKYPIGRGAAAVVWAGVQKGTNFSAAIKVVPVDSALPDSVKEGLIKEVNILRTLKHPNIVSYFGTVFRARDLWIIMDLCELGTIYDVLATRPNKRFTEVQASAVVASCVTGLAYLHGRGIIHRDLKSKNILLSPDGHAKIADFGVARQLGPVIATEKRSFIGTPLYMAPEIILENPYNAKADLWSLGIMAIELAEGQAPNSGLTPVIVLKRIVLSPSPRLREDLGFSSDFHDFVNQCLQKDINVRPSTELLLTHPFYLTGLSVEIATLSALAKEVKLLREQNGTLKPKFSESSLQFHHM